MSLLLAMWERPMSAWSFFDFAKLVILVAAFCAIVFIALKAMGINLPQWLIQMLVVVAVAFVAIVCLVLISSM